MLKYVTTGHRHRGGSATILKTRKVVIEEEKRKHPERRKGVRWAIWERAWRHYRRNPEKIPSQFSKDMISDFNYDDTNAFFDQILDNISGKLHTWAIFWYAAIYLHEALCLCPRESFVKNIGHDGSGVHCGKGALYETAFSHFYPVKVQNPVIESQTAREALKSFFKSLKPSFTHRMARKINTLLFKRRNSD